MNSKLRQSIAVVVFLLTANLTQAADIIVDTAGNCTLDEAIISANNDNAEDNGCTNGDGDDTIFLETDYHQTSVTAIQSVITIEGQGHLIESSSALSVYNGTLILNETTITGIDHYGGSGGLRIIKSTVILNNSTISGNTKAIGSSYSYGGGINVTQYSIVTINNSTISDNKADTFGGGIYCAKSSTITLNNSIISGNSAKVAGNEIYNHYNSCTIEADNYNLFGHNNITDDEAFEYFTPGSSDINATSDGTNTPLADILSPLADNGGSTLTHALPIQSPAIDLDPSCETNLLTDQRNTSRPFNSSCDAGAYEYGIHFKTYHLIHNENNTSVNTIGFIFENTGITTAHDLGLAIEYCDQVSKWDTATQTYSSHPMVSTTFNNFNIQVGELYFVSITQTHDFTITGTLPEFLNIPLYTTDTTNINTVALPKNKSHLTTAHELGLDIGNVAQVSKWDPITQTYSSHPMVATTFNNFPIEWGEGYFIGVTDDTNWIW
ncbi:MAG: hypothetical protein D3922_04980 [Candidatus Electrothrix sp. AR1]|nr:hypothetical protein [Candidatus Electrothrix sp. AR1]